MLRVELKKMLLYQRGFLILIFSALLFMSACILGGYDSEYAIDNNEGVYLSYIKQWQGEITAEKARQLDEEYSVINSGKKADYETNKEAFMVVYNQYFYAKEDAAHRYLLDERGWNTILTHDNINAVLLLCLMALLVPVFCNEYQCGMDAILRSGKNGRNLLAVKKIALMMGVSVLTTLFFEIIRLAVTEYFTGIEGLSYPLQSLQFFENSPYDITIGTAYLLVVLFRCIGAAAFALMIALLSVCLKKTILVFFAGISLSVLPHLLGGSYIKYVLPLPAGFLAGNGYLWGTLTEAGYNDDWEIIDIVTFKGIMPKQSAFIILSAVILWAVIFCICVRVYVGRQFRKHGMRIPPVICMVLVFVCLTGCRSNIDAAELTNDPLQGSSLNYDVSLDTLENKIYATSHNSGKTVEIPQKIGSKQETISSIYVTDQSCFYWVDGEVYGGFKIYQINLKDFSERLFYSSIDDNITSFWGLYQQNLTADEIKANMEQVEKFMVKDNKIYYLTGDKVICVR